MSLPTKQILEHAVGENIETQTTKAYFITSALLKVAHFGPALMVPPLPGCSSRATAAGNTA
ncbi:hypothetical protein R1X32_06865 (plasmid) [Rhodococcus opacus]|uniref:hypothetical protein n=1 Tax=Rhodococcus opacus TaxID=37919 RepID=UPI0034D15CDD